MSSEQITSWVLKRGLPLRTSAILGLCVVMAAGLVSRLSAQDTPAPEAPAAPEQPAKPLSAEEQKALIEDTNKAAVVVNPNEDERGGRETWGPPRVVFGHNAEVKAGEAVEALVVIGGSAQVHGRVREAAVIIGGDLEVWGTIGQESVAVLGNISAHHGAVMRGDTVAVGGRVKVSPGAQVHHQEGVEFPDVTWMRNWFVQCVLLMRPLSLKVTWVWPIAGLFLLLYVLIAALFPRPVRACVNELTVRPATTFCLGLLTILLFPLAIAILGVTGIGLLVVPFVLAAMFFGVMIGRVAVLEWIGGRIAHQFGTASFNNPLSGLLIGAVVIAAVYLVPFLGLLTFAIISLWSIGGAVTAAFGGLRREMPEKKPAPPAAPMPAPVMAAAGGAPFVAPTETPPDSAQGSSRVPPTMSAPVLPDVLAYPRASFWERLAAAFLDLILVGVLCIILHPIALVVALAYFAGLWAWRGTTIGGIVVGLKVARADGRPLTVPVTLVRSLAAAFSVLVLFLGFLWIAWDSEKQGWHDKIAGTVVLRLPRGTPLL
ncbi:MAG TPA: RDD family protein [Verrucomicrobiae bacterium]|nr:RDD family protein [Verrucomicrobiae bacterium]